MTLVKVIVLGVGIALHGYWGDRRPWFLRSMKSESWAGYEPFIGFEFGCPWFFADGYLVWRS